MKRLNATKRQRYEYTSSIRKHTEKLMPKAGGYASKSGPSYITLCNQRLKIIWTNVGDYKNMHIL